ncbi:hypothetical protein [Chryseobacterium wanjuense]
MATENPQNNSAQTLFRFVSLRNPQLTETKKENLGFIQRPSSLPSAFDDTVNPNDPALAKFQALERAAKSFDPAGYESELIIEEGILSEALKIGRKIAKKRLFLLWTKILQKAYITAALFKASLQKSGII